MVPPPCSINHIARLTARRHQTPTQGGESCGSRSLARFYKQPRLYSNACASLTGTFTGRNFHVSTASTPLDGYDEQDGHADVGRHREHLDIADGGSGLRVPPKWHSPWHFLHSAVRQRVRGINSKSKHITPRTWRNEQHYNSPLVGRGRRPTQRARLDCSCNYFAYAAGNPALYDCVRLQYNEVLK